jgi:hypothetical protein
LITDNTSPHTMKRPDTSHDETWENDAVWKLLDQSPAPAPSPRFVDDTVRAARLAGIALPWWKCLGPHVGLTSLAGGAAVAALTIIFTLFQPTAPDISPVISHFENAAHIEDVAETETLIAAMDHMDQFSDTELVSLIGF